MINVATSIYKERERRKVVNLNLKRVKVYGNDKDMKRRT